MFSCSWGHEAPPWMGRTENRPRRWRPLPDTQVHVADGGHQVPRVLGGRHPVCNVLQGKGPSLGCEPGSQPREACCLLPHPNAHVPETPVPGTNLSHLKLLTGRSVTRGREKRQDANKEAREDAPNLGLKQEPSMTQRRAVAGWVRPASVPLLAPCRCLPSACRRHSISRGTRWFPNRPRHSPSQGMQARLGPSTFS